MSTRILWILIFAATPSVYGASTLLKRTALAASQYARHYTTVIHPYVEVPRSKTLSSVVKGSQDLRIVVTKEGVGTVRMPLIEMIETHRTDADDVATPLKMFDIFVHNRHGGLPQCKLPFELSREELNLIHHGEYMLLFPESSEDPTIIYLGPLNGNNPDDIAELRESCRASVAFNALSEQYAAEDLEE